MFGTRWLAMLYGFAFVSHQVGGFLGVWLGGVRVRAVRLLHADLVALGAVRRAVGADQPADRGAAGRARRLQQPRLMRYKRLAAGRHELHKGPGSSAWERSRRSVIDKAEKGTTVALTQFDEAESDGRRRHRPRRVVDA